MHELGILYNMAKTVTEIAEENNIENVAEIYLEIGSLKGIIPQFLDDAFPYVAEQFPCIEKAKLKYRFIPAKGLCDDCNAIYDLVANEGRCPRCHSRNKKVLSGDDITIVQISG